MLLYLGYDTTLIYHKNITRTTTLKYALKYCEYITHASRSITGTSQEECEQDCMAACESAPDHLDVKCCFYKWGNNDICQAFNGNVKSANKSRLVRCVAPSSASSATTASPTATTVAPNLHDNGSDCHDCSSDCHDCSSDCHDCSSDCHDCSSDCHECSSDCHDCSSDCHD